MDTFLLISDRDLNKRFTIFCGHWSAYIFRSECVKCLVYWTDWAVLLYILQAGLNPTLFCQLGMKLMFWELLFVGLGFFSLLLSTYITECWWTFYGKIARQELEELSFSSITNPLATRKACGRACRWVSGELHWVSSIHYARGNLLFFKGFECQGPAFRKSRETNCARVYAPIAEELPNFVPCGYFTCLKLCFDLWKVSRGLEAHKHPQKSRVWPVYRCCYDFC